MSVSFAQIYNVKFIRVNQKAETFAINKQQDSAVYYYNKLVMFDIMKLNDTLKVYVADAYLYLAQCARAADQNKDAAAFILKAKYLFRPPTRLAFYRVSTPTLSYFER